MRVLLFAVLLAAQGASAQPGKEVTREFQAGVDAFRLGKHDEAKKHLERAKQLDPKLPGPNRFLAAVAQAQGRFADCVTAARTAIELNPASAEIADTRKLHDDCRRSDNRPTYSAELGDKAAIGITANVSGATVTIDSLVYGATPIEPRPITAGTHRVELAKPGHRATTINVNALAGIVTDLAIEMEVDPTTGPTDGLAKVTPRSKGSIVVVVPRSGEDDAFAGAEVRVDGARVELSRASVEGDRGVARGAGVAPGMRLLEVRFPGKDPWRRRVQVAAPAGDGSPDVRIVTPELVNTAARERMRTRGLWLTGAGVGFALAGGGLAYKATQDDRSLWKGLAGTAFGISAVTLGVGIWSLVRGQRPDLTAPPPLAVISVEGGVIATTGLRF